MHTRNIILFNNQVISTRFVSRVSVEELSADNCPRKFDVLKTSICPRSEASRSNMLVLRTSNQYQTDSSET